MKKVALLTELVLVGVISLIGSFGYSQQTLFVNNPPDSVVRIDPRGSSMNFVQGEILIKFKDEALVNVSMKSSLAQTGITSVDALFMLYKVTTAEKLFSQESPLKSKVMLRGYNGQEFEQPSLHNIYRLKVEDQMQLFTAIDSLSKDPNVVYAEPNYILSITNDKAISPPLTEAEAASWMNTPPSSVASPPSTNSTPNDPLYSQQWYIPAVHANAVWDSVNGSDSTQVIGILDTGVDWLHPDLTNKIWRNTDEIPGNGIDDDGNGKIDDVRGWDWINNDNNPTDDNSHGTHVAGIAAAQANNNIGISGVSWGAKIMPLKVFQSSGYGDAATISQGITYAKNNGATILNMSFGTYARSLTMEQALASAYATCVLAAAAGNDGICIGPGKCPPYYAFEGKPLYPGALSYVLGTQTNASWSNDDQDGPVYSKYPELLNYELRAPGTNILSTIPNGNYRVYQGTSMAAPVVSGCAAMYRKVRPLDSQELMFAKLIQSTTSYLNIDTALSIIPNIQLWFVSTTIVDTLSGDDNDGRVDAGETIQLWFKVRNTGGLADSVYTSIRFAEFEDTTTAQILTTQAYLGSISAYATHTNQTNPLKIHISPSVANAREICFVAKTWNKGSNDTVTQNVVLRIENGEELTGMLSDTLILTPDKLWLVNGSFKVTPTGVLIIKPGTYIQCTQRIINDGLIHGNGNQDSLIYISSTASVGIGGSSPSLYGNLHLNYVHLDLSCNYGIYCQKGSINNSVITFTGIYGFDNNREFFFENSTFHSSVAQAPFSRVQQNNTFYKCNFVDFFSNSPNWTFDEDLHFQYTSFFRTHPVRSRYTSLLKCNFLNNKDNICLYSNIGYYEHLPWQYWGTVDSIKISKKIYDFYDNSSYAELVFWPYLIVPSDSAQGFVWKILVNNKDAQDEVPDPVGIGPQKFDVYFNKPMNDSVTPQVTFGVRLPYTQTSVADSGHWSTDHKIYTCYKTVQLYTGDGINRIRVAGAKDLDGWEIPIEDMRFEFLIQAAGSASMDFQATPGLGKVALEWNNAGIPDLLGFNMYRFQHVTDTTFTNPVRVNASLILDTLYTDFSVIPNVLYYYYYKVVNTDFKESDSSSVVSCTPLTAAVGDANGDLLVNVLDITTIIAYMINQNPQPFIFDAADVNNDNVINILDVIGVVNILTGKKKDVAAGNPPAYIYLDHGAILFKTTQPVAGLQFELEGAGLEKVQLMSKLPGYELVSCVSNGKVIGILYSYSNKPLPLGLQNIIGINGETDQLRWGELVAGDLQGNPVKVIPDELHVYSLEDGILNVYPNPFAQSTNIQYELFEQAQVEIVVYDLYGRLIATVFSGSLPKGEFIKVWNGGSNGGMSNSGVYLIRFTATVQSGKTVKKFAKVVMIK